MPTAIGRFELHQIQDGIFALDGGALFGIVPKTLWSKKYAADERNRILLALRCLLICDGRRRILVDTGIGVERTPTHRDIYRIDSSPMQFDHQLTRPDYAREDITDVIRTHL